jgi:hypothetical protein
MVGKNTINLVLEKVRLVMEMLSCSVVKAKLVTWRRW